jgi:hypothetical protein
MQAPPTLTEDGEASIPIEIVSNSSNMNRTVALLRKAAKRTLPWDLAAEELLLLPSQPPQADDVPARKKPRLEEPISSPIDEAATNTASTDVSVGLPPPAADKDDANANPVTDTRPNAVANRVTARWTTEEDAELTSAITKTSKNKWGNGYKIDWVAISALIPGRTRLQCFYRWCRILNPNIDRTSPGRKGKWSENEDIKLKDAVQTHGTSWAAVVTRVTGRTRNQCKNRWYDALNPNITLTGGRSGAWTDDENSKLKDAIQTHGDKDWVAIAALVPGRTEKQCWSRWHDVLDPSIGRSSPGCTGKWSENEDIKLKDAVQTHGTNWAAIATCVPGRTRNQCKKRWYNAVNPNITLTGGRSGPWTDDENSKLMDAVQTHGDKDWIALSALVPGRTKMQCYCRWRDVLNPIIDRANGCKGKWTADEDIKLKCVVQAHDGKNWVAISALVPGRTKKQCYNRWHDVLDPSIDRANGRTGKWVEDEDTKLKNAVQTHGGKNWKEIAVLVPCRTKMQCYNRWKDVLDPSIDRANERTGK